MGLLLIIVQLFINEKIYIASAQLIKKKKRLLQRLKSLLLKVKFVTVLSVKVLIMITIQK